jgi:hypothetical protein
MVSSCLVPPSVAQGNKSHDERKFICCSFSYQGVTQEILLIAEEALNKAVGWEWFDCLGVHGSAGSVFTAGPVSRRWC